jgi:hypothetical protein
LSKNRPVKPVKFPQAQSQKLQTTISKYKANPETLSRRPSSPAAPPPSFSEGAYTAIPFSKSTEVFEKTEISIISLNSNRDFQFQGLAVRNRPFVGSFLHK